MSSEQVKVNDLAGACLDYWVAKAEGLKGSIYSGHFFLDLMYRTTSDGSFTPSRPGDGYMSIAVDKYSIQVGRYDNGQWCALGMIHEEDGWCIDANLSPEGRGDTAILAVCRCVVVAKFGETVTVEDNEYTRRYTDSKEYTKDNDGKAT